MDLTGALRLHWPGMPHLFALLCLVAVVYKIIFAFAQKRDLMRKFEAFPGPPANWLFGNVLQIKQDGTSMFKVLEWGRQYPYAFPIWIGPSSLFLNIHHPDYAKTILATPEPKDDLFYGFVESWIGNGLLVSKGQKWFRHRRLLTPGFHYDTLKSYVKLMEDSTKIMLDKWERYGNGTESFELFEHVSLMTLDTILKCAFSCNSRCQTEGGRNPYINAVYELSHLINLRLRTFPYHSDLIFSLSPHGYRYRKARAVSYRHTESVLKERKKKLNEEQALERIQAKRNMDFLDILLLTKDENQQGLSDEDIRAEVDTFMFEGHDTTASGLSFILYNLACNPEHQTICRDEIKQVLNDKENIEWEDLNQIPYTTMCIKESLRLHPPVPGTSRRITKPITFCDGRTLPAGSVIGTSVFGIHRNETVWENPHVFDPLRFLPENISKRSSYAFVPFSAGPRNCIGQNFAMNELKIATILTLRKFQLIEDPTRKPLLIPQLILRSINGIHIKIKSLDM
ncbi:cytochrome P450 4T8 [Brachionichthys hirsutus]|uniref:cytochrome P450 4T8 n=1 Tax=Brachionichthys hirsutus TaxID=412623 RepID=UPI003604CCC7